MSKNLLQEALNNSFFNGIYYKNGNSIYPLDMRDISKLLTIKKQMLIDKRISDEIDYCFYYIDKLTNKDCFYEVYKKTLKLDTLENRKRKLDTIINETPFDELQILKLKRLVVLLNTRHDKKMIYIREQKFQEAAFERDKEKDILDEISLTFKKHGYLDVVDYGSKIDDIKRLVNNI
jgi:hypothetical protein